MTEFDKNNIKRFPFPIDKFGNFDDFWMTIRFWIIFLSVLLSTACPNSLASDQTKGGGRSGVQRTPRFGAESERSDPTKIHFY